MKLALRTLAFCAAALLPLAWAVSCESASPESFFGVIPDSGEDVQTHVALSLEPRAELPATKMSDDITQIGAASNNNIFRGIERVFIIPFNTTRAITASENRHGWNLELPQAGIAASWGASANSGLVTNNNSHLYENVLMKAGTASVLVYGRAIDENVSVSPDSVNFKRRNGVLRSHGLESEETPNDMWFELEPILNTSAESSLNSSLQGVLTYLNSIAGAQVSVTGYTARRSTTSTTWTYNWKTPAQYSNEQTLQNAFQTLTGDGLAFSGSTEGIAQVLTSVYNGLYNISNSTSASNSYTQTYYNYNSYSYSPDNTYYYVYELARQIRSLINNSTYVSVSGSGNSATVTFKNPYAGLPASYGVPDGAVAVQWNGSSFVQVSANNSALAPVSSYCYPPSLWYWTSSRLKTTNNESIINQYVSSNPTWDSILAQYTSGSTVIPGVASTAVREPLQYGVAQLRLCLNDAVSEGGTDNLLDSKATAINVSNSNFPLTGVLISEQRNQAFNFTPKAGDNHCIYDSDVNDGLTPKAYIASSTSGVTQYPVHTLVVQTENNQDVHFALEFQNNSGNKFYGANSCIVAPGSKFYLVGILKMSEATTRPQGINSIFVQDHITEVAITVQKLVAAYNTIPELRDPQLEIGVQTEMKWVGSTPSQIPMY